MNLLQMTQKCCNTAGLDIPNSLDGLDYYQELCKQRVIDSWVEIQSEKCSRWRFLSGRASVYTIANKANYTATELGISNLSHFIVGNTRIFEDGDFVGDLTHIDRDKLLELQEVEPKIEMPIYWSDVNVFALSLYPTPDKVYEIKIDYYENPVYLAEATDTPNVSEEHHQVIVDLADHKYSIVDNNPELEIQSMNDFESKLNRLSLDYCPQITTSRGKKVELSKRLSRCCTS